MSYKTLLYHLNETNGTDYSLQDDSVYDFVRHCAKSDMDFGYLYALLRPYIWESGDFNLRALEEIEDGRRDENAYKYHKLQTSDFGDDVIYHPRGVRGRRVWDLQANRVIPLSYADDDDDEAVPYYAVSHSWVDVRQRYLCDTPVNGYEWSVSLPRGVTLDLLRTELHNYGARYVWLDVLCLRQKDSKVRGNRALYDQEMRIDLPTLGNIYEDAEKVVVYLNGLGKPSQQVGWDDRRHWFQRVWNMLEIQETFMAGGVPATIASHDQMVHMKNEQGVSLGQRLRDLGLQRRALYLLRQDNSGKEGVGARTLFWVVEEVRRRRAENPSDRIDVIRFLWCRKFMPAYPTGTPVQLAWESCVKYADAQHQAAILFLLPPSYDGKWIPSWKWVSQTDSNLPSVSPKKLAFTDGGELHVLRSGALEYKDCIVVRGFDDFWMEQDDLYISKGKRTYSVEPVETFNNFEFRIPKGPFILVTTRSLSFYLVCAIRGRHNRVEKLFSVTFDPDDVPEIDEDCVYATVTFD